MPPNWNPYFPWYPTTPPMIVTIGKFNGGRKLLNYPKYTKNLDLDACVCVFKETIKINGVTQKGTKITYFQWTLWDTTSVWEKNFVNSHPKFVVGLGECIWCTFSEFAQTFHSWYYKVQIDEQVYMNLQMVKQYLNDKVEEYYEQFLTLANSLQCLVND